ncbi:hypothetical protein ALC53_12341 [Atta colombica]|uniref:Uncharacterized protein n=1 Tax=Atta colombica TaxID=520822 RepID=A0A195AZ98_9HYME|nr:hypothetical protein ALC53_12341 [Atta colombica]
MDKPRVSASCTCRRASGSGRLPPPPPPSPLHSAATNGCSTTRHTMRGGSISLDKTIFDKGRRGGRRRAGEEEEEENPDLNLRPQKAINTVRCTRSTHTYTAYHITHGHTSTALCGNGVSSPCAQLSDDRARIGREERVAVSFA